MAAKIKITSANQSIETGSFFAQPLCEPEKLLESAKIAMGDFQVMQCVGAVFEKDGKVEIVYTEPSIEGSVPCTTTLSFSDNIPNMLKIKRESAEMHTEFTVSAGKKNLAMYKTPYGKFKMCTFAKKVNCTKEKISLDYAVELQGLTPQRTVMTIEILH